MDRRKIKSNNLLQRKLYCSSQTVTDVTLNSEKGNGISRSISTSVSRSRKRKSSEEENKLDLHLSSTLMNSINAKKKRCNIVNSDSDSSNEESVLPKPTTRTMESDNSKKKDNFVKPLLSEKGIRKKSKNSDKDEESNHSQSSGGSSIRGFLEALDKSPSKLSQSSTTSIDKYRKMNLRTPVRSKTKRPLTNLSLQKKQKIEEEIKDKQKSAINTRKKNSSVVVNTSYQSSTSTNNSENEDDSTRFSPINTFASKAKDSQLNNLPNINNGASTSTKKYLSSTKNNTTSVLDSPELSPLKIFNSPEKNNLNNCKKKICYESDNQLINFLNASGIHLYSGDSLHVADNDPREVVHKMKELLLSKGVNIDEIIQSWNNYIEDEDNLKKSLLEMKIETEEGVIICSKALSLSRLLLQVPQLQVEITNSLFKKLIDAVITSDSSDDAPWALQLLQQFRFLEVLVDSDLLVIKIEELLNTSPEWFQREIIVFIPDIVTDIQHRTTAEMLVKIMEKNSDLTNIVLDCLYNLILGKDYREELREQILKLLDNKFEKSVVPAITRFVLTSCTTEEIALKSLNILRLIDMSPSEQKKCEECYTYQTFMVNALKMSIQLFKEVTQASIIIIKNSALEALPFDIILLILLYETMVTKKKIVEVTLYSHIKDGYYTTSLLHKFYIQYKQVARSFQSTALTLAINLLKVGSPAHVEFGIEWLRYMFISQSETTYKQREIMEKLLNLMGGKDKTVKNALEVLCRMANEEIERKFLQQHVCFLRSFLDKIDNLQFDEVSTLYHILHGLCTQSELISNILNDDLSIIMQKQLYSSKVLTKCKGVLGAIMAVKHLAGNNESSDQAYELLKKTFCSLKGCVKSQALFYDQLSQVIVKASNINEDFLSNTTSYFEDIFVNSCLVDNNSNDNLVPKYGLNDPSMAENYYINFEDGKIGAFVPVFFKLLRICNLRLSGSLESINAVLGCSILMPKDMDLPDPLVADYMIHCINWFREIISGFVTQEETLLRQQVLKRLESLMILQGEFATMIAMCENRYQPPPCYFHYFPVPPFVKVDIKIGKKKGRNGKTKKKQEDNSEPIIQKSVELPEWENWEIGSELSIKNPAFFRQMDTKIVNLLDTNLNTNSTQALSDSITVAQVCFIVKELLGMFANQASESFVKDVIQLLPKICTKLKEIVDDLKKNDNTHEKEAVRLLLCLLNTIFSWKEFQTARYNILLRDGLRTLAGMLNESNALLRSCKDLVAEAYKYFESLADIVTQVSLAVALTNMCNCLLKHSNSFFENARSRQANMAYGFLCLEWLESHGGQYKVAIKELLKSWLDNEPDPLRTVGSVLEWLPEQASLLERQQSLLPRLASISKANLHLLIKQLFTGLVKGVEISLEIATKDPERIRTWLHCALYLDKLSNICKMNKNNVYLILFLRYTTILYQMLLTSGMKLLEANVKYQTEDVLAIIKLFQRSGRFLRDIFCTARKEKNTNLLKLIPLAKSRRERFIYRVKGMLTANNSIGAFWMGNLLNKDLDGETIVSECSGEIISSSITSENNAEIDGTESEICSSSSEDSVDEEE